MDRARRLQEDEAPFHRGVRHTLQPRQSSHVRLHLGAVVLDPEGEGGVVRHPVRLPVDHHEAPVGKPEHPVRHSLQNAALVPHDEGALALNLRPLGPGLPGQHGPDLGSPKPAQESVGQLLNGRRSQRGSHPPSLLQEGLQVGEHLTP